MTQPPWGNGTWQLYNLAQDPSESRDLADSEAELFDELKARWHAYAETNQVVVFENGRVPAEK